MPSPAVEVAVSDDGSEIRVGIVDPGGRTVVLTLNQSGVLEMTIALAKASHLAHVRSMKPIGRRN